MKSVKEHATEITGVIRRFTANKHFDIDGMEIEKGGEVLAVKFPPHTARFVQVVAGIGDKVKVGTDEKPHPPHHKDRHHKPKLHLSWIESISGGKRFEVDAVKPPHPVETGRVVGFSISQPVYTRGGKENEITGVIHEGNFFHLHPDEYEADLDPASVLVLKAKKRSDKAGFVNEGGYAVYHTHSVSVERATTK